MTFYYLINLLDGPTINYFHLIEFMIQVSTIYYWMTKYFDKWLQAKTI